MRKHLVYPFYGFAVDGTQNCCGGLKEDAYRELESNHTMNVSYDPTESCKSVQQAKIYIIYSVGKYLLNTCAVCF